LARLVAFIARRPPKEALAYRLLLLCALLTGFLDPVLAASADNSIVRETVGGILEVTVSDIPAPDLSALHLIAHGDAVLVTASLNGSPLPPGALLPVAVSTALAYSLPLPTAIPDDRLLAPYFGDGTTWSRLDCAAGACSQVRESLSFQVSLDRVGSYAIGAPELGAIAIMPTSGILYLGGTLQFAATVTDGAGSPITYAPISWQAIPSAGSIDQTGLFTATGSAGVYAAAVTASLGSLSASAQVQIVPRILYLPSASKEWAVRLLPDDPYYGWQWNMEHIRAPYAWTSGLAAEPPVIAVLDTGVELNHPDLVANLVAGWDFVHGDATPQDDNGHGTHVAGIAGAVGNNAVGVAGLSWRGRIMPVKILDQSGIGDPEVTQQGVHWAVDHGARIVNLSLGTYDNSPYLEEAVSYALSMGAVVVAAAGNVGSSLPMGTWVYPAAYPGVIAVGASDSNDNVAGFSNQGPFLDVVAPGVAVLSTYLRGGYTYMSGTSMATPHVSGLAALIWSTAPTIAADRVAQAIIQTARDLGNPGWDSTNGYGLIDAGKAVSWAQQPPATSAVLASGQDMPPSPQSPPPGTYRPGFVLVRLSPNGDRTSVQRALSQAGTLSAQDTSLPDVLRVAVPAGAETEYRARLAATPGVASVYLDVLVFAMN